MTDAQVSLPGPGDEVGGRYRIDSPLGSGGFATVWRATDTQTGRAVAVKVLHPDERGAYSAYRLARFGREVEATRSLQSPHTVTLLDAGHDPRGAPYLVFELVEGQDLGDLLKASGPLPPAVVRRILLQILESLAEAHGRGLLHRDIKPANIRVFSTGDEPYRVKLLDFGIAKPTSVDAPSLTATGRMLGTLKYCAPEQAFGGVLTPSSDLYALAVVAYELLTGAPCDHLRVIAQDGVVALTPEQCADDGLRAVLNRMLALEPERRFASAAEVRRVLRGGQTGATPRQPEPPALDPPRQTSSMTRVILVAFGTVAVGLAVLGALRLIRQPEPVPLPVRPLPSAWRFEPAADVGAPGDAARPAEADAGGGVVDAGSAHCSAAPPFRGLGKLTGLDGLQTATWLTYIPHSYTPGSRHPLVMLLHESGETAADFFGYTRIAGLAEREGIVVIAPQGRYIEAWVDSTDAAVIALRQTTTQLCVDPERVYLIGHGYGATAAEEIPCTVPIAAIATTANRNPGDRPCMTSAAAPRIHLAGLEDRYNPVDGGAGCTTAQKISLSEQEATWRKVYGCSNERSRFHSHKKSVCYTWPCTDGEFVSCHLDGGRNWPGVHERLWDVGGCDGEPADFPFLDVIWDFFARHRRSP